MTATLTDQWAIRGLEYSNCNCAYGCPCQFNAPSTHGNCQAVAVAVIEEGNFNDTKLDGIKFAMILDWPGEIAEGKGRVQLIIDESTDAAQREAIIKIASGQSTKPGATHYFVFSSTMSTVYDPIYATIHAEIDLDARMATLNVPGLIESRGTPIIDPFSGGEHRIAIEIPDGFEYTRAEIGSGVTKTQGEIKLDLEHTYGQFNLLHMNQDGVIR